MKNAIEIERVQNGWIVRAGVGLLSNGLESVAMCAADVKDALSRWLADEGSRPPKAFPFSSEKDQEDKILDDES